MPRRMLAFSVVIVALMLGCSRTDPVSTDRAGTDVESAIRGDASRFPNGFYPLAIGNRWQSTRAWTAKFIVDGGPPPGWPESGGEDYEFEHICTEIRGLPYIVESQRWYDDEGNGGTQFVRYRQDPSGLYEADLCLCELPECIDMPIAEAASSPYERVWQRMEAQLPNEVTRAAARRAWDRLCGRLADVRGLSAPSEEAARSSEITRLKYPLYPGQSWAVRNDGDFVIKAGVEAFEVIDLPLGRVPAYRIRFSSPSGPDEIFDFQEWWGRCGLMRTKVHLEAPLLGDDGEPIGTIIWDELQEVTDINLVDLRPCTIAEE